MRSLTLDEKISIRGVMISRWGVDLGPGVDMRNIVPVFYACSGKSILHWATRRARKKGGN